jgi:beta-glucosidase
MSSTSLASLQPCNKPENSGLPFCNVKLSLYERARDLVSRLTREEKIQQLGNTAPGIDRLFIPPYNWWTESLHGVLGSCTDDERCPTSYPAPIGLGATFNKEIIQKMASQISSEARRMFVENEAQQAKRGDKWHFIGLDFWAPNINIFRDPRW